MSKKGRRRAKHAESALAGKATTGVPGRGELLFVASVPTGGESLAVRELIDLGARAKIHGEGRVRFRADRSTIVAVTQRARILRSISWRIESGTREELETALGRVAWGSVLPPGQGVAIDASAEEFRSSFPDERVVESMSRDSCIGSLRGEEDRKGARALYLDLRLDLEAGHPITALALRYAAIEPGSPLRIFSSGGTAVVGEAARCIGGDARSPASDLGWLPFDGEALPSAVIPAQESPESSSSSVPSIIAFEDDPWVRERLENDGGGVVRAVATESAAQFLGAQSLGEEKPGAEKPGAEKPGAEKPGAEKPGAENPGAESPRAAVTVLHVVPDLDAVSVTWNAESIVARFRAARRARHIVLTRSVALLEHLGRTPERRKTFGAGGIDWTVAVFEAAEIITPATAVHRARPATDLPPGVDDDERRFAEIVTENARLRRRWPQRYGTDAYRIYDRDVPSIPLAVDRYGDALHITVYPGDGAQGRERIDRWAHRAGVGVGVDPARVFVKRKARRSEGAQHEVQAREGARTVVREGGLKLIVNLSDYVDTGLFLDHRDTRAAVRKEIDGKRLLNLFCYTGAFTVAAAAGGARSTTSVDTSQTYLDWARQNLQLNEFDGEQHVLVRADALEFLREHLEEERYDVAIVDPPTYSNRHGGASIWDVQRDHVTLLELLRPLMAPGGVVIFSTNFRRFKLDAAALAGWQIEETTPASIPPDIGDRRVHRAWRMVLEPTSKS